MSFRQQTDIAIIGGGVAGCATAIAVKKQTPNLKVLIIDASQEGANEQSHKGQAYTHTIRPGIGETLPPEVIIPLQQLGLWQAFEQAGFAESAGTIAIWGEDRPHGNEYIYSPYGSGWRLDRSQFDQLMVDEAMDRNVKFLSCTKFTAFVNPPKVDQVDTWRLCLQATDSPNHISEWSADFVVDATGRTARPACRIGATKHNHDQLVGIYRFYGDRGGQHQDQHGGTLVEGVANGWWYSARLPGGQRVVAFMTDADVARSNGFRLPDRFDKALNCTHHISTQLRGLVPLSGPLVTAAHTQSLDQMAGRGWLAVGDAAFTYDPLSALGIFKALRMSIIASYAIHDYFAAIDPELTKYQYLARSEFADYLVKRAEYYAEETRFPDEPFWRRRLAA
jgi:flavin-dependent dehydrogenase